MYMVSKQAAACIDHTIIIASACGVVISGGRLHQIEPADILSIRRYDGAITFKLCRQNYVHENAHMLNV